MKILEIGPSPEKSQGGMATVIQGIQSSKKLNEKFSIETFDSFIDGNIIIRVLHSIAAFFKFKKIYEPYNLFHVHMASYRSTYRKLKYVDFLKKHNKKVIIHIHGGSFMRFYEKQNDKKKKYIKDALNNAEMVIGLSDKWKEKFESKFGLVNCVSLSNGIDIEQYEKAIVAPEVYQESFIFLGRLGKGKGAYDLVDAIEQAVKVVPNLKCYMAGDGEVDKFRELIRERKLEKNIEVVGWVNLDKKMELLKNVATLVLPSYSEGLPMAVLEGMACGKAIISTSVGAIPEVVKVENGIIIQPGDVSSLEKALISCCKDKEMMQTMSKANIQKIDQEFSMRNMHQKLEAYYNEVLKGI